MVKTLPISEVIIAKTVKSIAEQLNGCRKEQFEFSPELVAIYHNALANLSQEGGSDLNVEVYLRSSFNILARDFLCKAFAKAQTMDFRAANGIAAAILNDDLSDDSHISRQAELYSGHLIEHFRAYGDQEMIDKIVAARSVLWPN